MIDAAGSRIHLNCLSYPTPTEAVGTLVIAHGIAGYGRFLAPLGICYRSRKGEHDDNV